MTSDEDGLAPGTRISEFVVERVLGAGGFGVTYLAHDRNLDRRVAIKEYLPRDWGARRANGTVGPRSSSAAEDYRWGLARFLDEARTLARLDDARIVRVHQVLEARGTAYMVTEYVEGRNLEEVLQAEGPWSETRVRALLEALLPGLAAVHRAGLVHRDVKPANIMLRSDGATPVLIDFGAARYAAGTHSRSLTSVLTPGYAPHEQYHAGRQGPWTDIYALGAVAYRALSGRVPVDASARVDAHARAARVRFSPDRGGEIDPLSPVSAVAAGRVSAAFGAAVTAALSVWPEDRPQDVAAWQARWDGGQAAGPPESSAAAAGDGDGPALVGEAEPRRRSPDGRRVDDAGHPGSRRPPGTNGTGRRVAYGAAVLAAVGVAFGAWLNRDTGEVRGVPPPMDAIRSDTGTAAAPESDALTSRRAGGLDTTPPAGPPDADGTRTSRTASVSTTPEQAERALGLDGAAWRILQAGLARAGFDPGPADGQPGLATREAVRRWQETRGADATGYLTAETAQALRRSGARDVREPDVEEDVEAFSPALGRDWSPSHVDEDGWTDLHYAAALNRPDLAMRLLDAAAPVDALTREYIPPGPPESPAGQTLHKFEVPSYGFYSGFTPLHVAARVAAVDVAGLLLARGADIEALPRMSPDPPLTVAAASGHIEMVALLLDGGAKVDGSEGARNPIEAAAEVGAVDVMALLVKRGAKIAPALAPAARSGQVEVAAWALDRGANVDDRDSFGRTAMESAAFSGDIEMAAFLLNRGAILDFGDRGGYPLAAATLGGHVEMVAWLLDLGATIDAENADGHTALTNAAFLGYSDVVELLLDRGASLDKPDADGRTALRRSAIGGRSNVVELLLDRGASLDGLDDYIDLVHDPDVRALLDFRAPDAQEDSVPCTRQFDAAGSSASIFYGTLNIPCSTVHYENGRHAAYHGFTLDKAMSIVIEMTSMDVNSWLALRSGSPPGNGTALEEDDDDGGGPDARIERFLQAGNYTVEATTRRAGEAGDYELTIRFLGNVPRVVVGSR